MQAYRYILEKGSKKHHCPNCNKKSFVRFIDTYTGQYLPIKYGRCDRESNCGYFSDPYTDGYGKDNKQEPQPIKTHLKPRAKTINYPFPFDEVEKTLKGYERNTFIQNLLNRVPYPFPIEAIEKVISLYYLGTITKGYWQRAVTFPFIDEMGNIRTVQVKQFDEGNHTTGTNFLHAIIEKQYRGKTKVCPDWLTKYLQNERKVSCLFGEHLLNAYPTNPVALVEAPKTAIYGTLYFGLPAKPQDFIWIAVFNLSSLKAEKCKVLENRKVVLFPDLSKDGHAYNDWKAKAEKFTRQISGAKFLISDFLEKHATQQQRNKGLDLADFLIKLNWKDFREETPAEQPPRQRVKSVKSDTVRTSFFLQDKPAIHKPESKESKRDWTECISELENFFSGKRYNYSRIKLTECEVITDTQKFVNSHLPIVRANNGNKTYLPYLNRLIQLKNELSKAHTTEAGFRNTDSKHRESRENNKAYQFPAGLANS
jgi:hypothetical protein